MQIICMKFSKQTETASEQPEIICFVKKCRKTFLAKIYFGCLLKQYVKLLKYNTPISCICQVFTKNIEYIVVYF